MANYQTIYLNIYVIKQNLNIFFINAILPNVLQHPFNK